MVSAFFGLNTGLRALLASQLALDTAAHNTANVGTPGYTRQRVSLVAADPYSYPAFNRTGLPGQVGTGVSVVLIGRVRDAFVDLQLRQETQLAGSWTARSAAFERLQAIFPEPGTAGLATELGRFWNAWQDLAADPGSSAARSALLGRASTLAQRFQGAARGLDQLVAEQDAAVRQGITDVNSLAERIATLNGEIKRVAVTGDQPNDLLDERDRLLDRLAELVPATLEPQADGTVKVLVGGVDLVTDERARRMVAADDAAGHAMPTWQAGPAVTLAGGRLGQLVQLRDVDIPPYAARLDQLAAGIADAVNALHATGVDQDGNAGLAVFVSSSGPVITAGTISLNQTLAGSPRLVAAAAAANSPGDGTIAGRIADLRSGAIIGTVSAGDFYAALIGGIGSDARHAMEMAANQDLVRAHLETRRESLSGVSLDEEATDMVRFQRMYQAAARVITIMDQNLDTLINSTGVVGR